MSGRALADDAPRYAISGRPALVSDENPEDLAREPISRETLLELIGAPNARDRKPIWRRYDHMNGTNTLVGPGAGDAALLRVKGTTRALALAIDGPSPARVGALDPYLAGASAVVEGAVNVAVMGARPIGITDCLNFGSPETDLGAYQLERAIDGIADACRALGLPVVSGNVSLYNETPDGPILPTPVVGTIGVLEDRAARMRMAWDDGDELWLLGEAGDDAAALAGSELAWRRERKGGVPSLDVEAAARLVRLLATLSGTARAAHDSSVGGIGVALARMALAAGIGATVDLGPSDRPTALLHGERAGRVIISLPPGDVGWLRAALAAAGVRGRRIGAAGGSRLVVRVDRWELAADLDELRAAWTTALG